MLPPAERRSHRSDDPPTALGLQLEQTRFRARLEAVVLADASGIVLAFAGEERICTALGAVAPLAPLSRKACLIELAGGGDIAVRALMPHGYPLFLAALGGTAARDAVLASAAQGIERILLCN